MPRHLSPRPDVATHSIFVPEENFRIPLEMRGVVSLFYTRLPTPEEIESCRWLMFTSEAEWDPHSEDFMQNELAMTLRDPPINRVIYTANTCNNPGHIPETDGILSSISNVYSEGLFHEDLNMNSIYTYPDIRIIMSRTSSQRRSNITKEDLCQLWGINAEIAAQTLRVTTQKGIRNAVHPIVRRYATKQSRLRYNQLGSRHGRFYSDTFFANIRSTRRNVMAQLFVNDVKYLRIMPMQKKSEAGSALLELIQDIGIPSAIHTDGAKEETLGKWKQVCQDFGIKQTLTEPYSPWQNRAELNIREAKKKILRLMSRTHTPKALWDYCATYVADITCFNSSV